MKEHKYISLRQHNSAKPYYEVRLSVKGQRVHVGNYRTLEAAIDARDKALSEAKVVIECFVCKQPALKMRYRSKFCGECYKSRAKKSHSSTEYGLFSNKFNLLLARKSWSDRAAFAT